MFSSVAIGGVVFVAVSVTARAAWPLVMPKVKGFVGESRVRLILSLFRGKDFAKIHDLLIPGGRETTQIDHILISRYGIFVIETKNYVGQILGGLRDKMWTQVYRNGQTRDFLNPLIQNEIHTKAVRALLRAYPNVPIHSLVVFGNDSAPPALPGITKMSQLRLAIKVRCKGEPVLSTEDVQDIASIIRKSMIKDRKARKQHDAKALLAAKAAKNQRQEDLEALLERGKKAPLLSFGEKRDEQVPAPEVFKLTDEGSVLHIRGKRGSITDFFEDAKRDVDGDPVPRGASFDHFICPYTGDPFPVSEAKSLYHGLWLAYLKRNPDLVEYLNTHPTEHLGDTFQCKKVLAAYAQDAKGFVAQARDTAWYRNMEKKLSEGRKPAEKTYNRQRKPLDQQISGAEQRKSKSTPTRDNNKSFARS